MQMQYTWTLGIRRQSVESVLHRPTQFEQEIVEYVIIVILIIRNLFRIAFR